MPRNPSPAQSNASKQNGKRSRGPTSSGASPKSPLDITQAGLRAETIALAHESILRSERAKHWHDFYQSQSPIGVHLTNECARASLLADRVEQFRQAELEKQVRQEERTWNRRERRRVRYLAIKLKTRPDEAVEQLLAFGQGVGFLGDAFEGLIDEVRTWGHLPPHVAMLGLQVCGCTQEPASIGRSPLAYVIHINNLGCTPGVPAADIDQWLEPARRPAALRNRPRHEVIGADPQECRARLLEALETELDRLKELFERVREEVDLPSLGEALDRVSILTDASARRAARNHTEARLTFHRASNDLVKTIARERADGPLSFVPGPLSAGSGAEAEAGVQEETMPVDDRPEGDGDGAVGVDQGLGTAPDAGPMPGDCRDDGFFATEPENGVDVLMTNHDETTTYVEARVPDPGCAKVRKTGAQTAPEPAQTGAKAPADVTDQAPGSDEETGADQTRPPWTYRVPLSACRRAGSYSPSDPEKPGIRNESPEPARSTLDDSGHDPLLAVIAKYQREFDAELRPYDHLE